jgi:hypothetical protein
MELIKGLVSEHSDGHASAFAEHKIGLADELEKRMKLIKGLVSEHADGHASAFAEHKTGLADELEKRMELIKGLVSEHADGHASTFAEHKKGLAEELEKRMELIAGLVDQHAGKHANHIAEHSTAMEQRMETLQNLVNQGTEKHANHMAEHKNHMADHKASVEQRLQLIEGLVNQNADTHANNMTEHRKHIADHKEILEQRFGFIEGLVNQHADKHAQHIADHRTAVEQRMEVIEGLLNQQGDQHANHLAEHKNTIAEHRMAIEQRIEQIKSLVDQNADKHENFKAEHRNHILEHKATIEKRMDTVEDLVKKNANMHASMISDLAAKVEKRIAGLDGIVANSAESITSCVQFGKSLEQRIDTLTNLVGLAAEKHDAHKTAVDSHMDNIDVQLKDLADKHATAVTAIDTFHSTFGDLQSAITSCVKTVQDVSLHDRLTRLEAAQIGGTNQLHAEHRSSMETLETRIEYVEALVGDSASEHAKEIALAKTKLGDIHAALTRCVQSEHHGSLEQRIGHLESTFTECMDKAKGDIEGSHKYIEDRLDQMTLYLNEYMSSYTREFAARLNSERTVGASVIETITPAVALPVTTIPIGTTTTIPLGTTSVPTTVKRVGSTVGTVGTVTEVLPSSQPLMSVVRSPSVSRKMSVSPLRERMNSSSTGSGTTLSGVGTSTASRVSVSPLRGQSPGPRRSATATLAALWPMMQGQVTSQSSSPTLQSPSLSGVALPMPASNPMSPLIGLPVTSSLANDIVIEHYNSTHEHL